MLYLQQQQQRRLSGLEGGGCIRYTWQARFKLGSSIRGMEASS